MSPHPSILSKPVGEARLSPRAIGYVQTATRLELHQLVMQAFAESGITQVTLARRLGKRPEQISRLLGAPGNWTLDTFAELLFAIDGSLARVERRSPIGDKPTNSGAMGWRPSEPLTSNSSSTAKMDIVW